MDVTLPHINMVPATVLPVAEEALMGGDEPQQPPPPALVESLSVGEPVAIGLSPEWAASDADLAGFIRAEARTHRYWLVHLACTLTPAPGSRIESANLTTYLGREDGATGTLPIAMSMSPERVRDIQPLKTARSLKLSTDLKIVEPAVEYGWASERDEAADVIVAYNLQKPQPFWALKGNSHLPLEGSFRFAMVVRAGRGTAANLKVALDGRARERRFGMFRFRVSLPPSLSEPVRLP
jgi:hypothetical protein